MTDYYETLGVAREATQDQIKKAYREMAKKYHPDAKSSTKDEGRFKKINEAYQVLSDPKKKQAYDQFGEAAFSQTGGFGQGPFGFDPFGFSGAPRSGQYGPFTYTYSSSGDAEASFEDLFGGAFSTLFGGAPFGFGRRSRGRDLRYQITIDFADAVHGAEPKIQLGGREIKIKIPEGARDGLELRFKGEGEEGAGPRGEVLPRGDLYVILNVLYPKSLSVQDADIYSEKEISVYDALLGEVLPVTIVDAKSPSGLGEEKLKIPAGTQPGTLFRLRGKGMPYLRGRGRGDAYVRVNVKITEKLSREERQALERLRDWG